MYNEESTELFCRRQMSADEHVLWSGRPEKSGLFMSGAELGSFIFSIIWTIFACAMCISAMKSRMGISFVGYLPLLFPIVGIILIVSQLRKFLVLRNQTEYVITNKRIYRRSGKRLDNFAAAVAVGYETNYHRNGNATFTFPMAVDPSKPRVRTNGREVLRHFTINNVAEPDRVQQALSRMENSNF